MLNFVGLINIIMNKNFTGGDWCFCEFKLQQIQKMDGERITSVSDGYISLSGNDLSDKCFPLDMNFKTISDEFFYWHRKFHDLQNTALNYPDLHRELVSRWIEVCNRKDEEDFINESFSKLSNFYNEVINKVSELQNISVDGVSIFVKNKNK